MPVAGRKDLLAGRRRRADAGEDDEESVLGDLEDESISAGSAASDGGGEGAAERSDFSVDEPRPSKDTDDTTESPVKTDDRDGPFSTERASKAPPPFHTTADTNAMLQGLQQGHTPQDATADELHFDDVGPSSDKPATPPPVTVPRAPRNETAAQRSRREHQEYIRQRDANPAFVPTRGGFFLHDDRNATSNGLNTRPFGRGRGRAFGPPPAGRGLPFRNEPLDQPWAHDLHEPHEMAPKPDLATVKPAAEGVKQNQEMPPPSTTAPLNRTFSFSTVLGNVTVHISVPGMAQKVAVLNVVKKHHTLLPQHRPPLRRDKPVRVSIPDAAPRYIFPSTERSFIFIPRALRPNQQGYGRGRGRGSFHGSRRPSIYGSTYTPSVALSRRSSIGATAMMEGMRSPAESIMSRVNLPSVDGGRPIVRMPSAVPTPSLSRTGMPLVNGQVGVPTPVLHAPPAPLHGSYATSIPMHQPRPQKAVSVADIESPASFQFKAPPRPLDHPFHQQVPPHMPPAYTDDRAAPVAQPSLAGAAALSQIPEGSVYGQGFQPYSVMGGPAPYFAPPFGGGGAVFYPSAAGAASFPVGGAAALAPSFVPGSQAHGVGYGAAAAPGGLPPHLVAHESNGMVYYYNPPMFAPNAQGSLAPYSMTGTAGMAMGTNMAAQPPFYYASGAGFYAGQSG